MKNIILKVALLYLATNFIISCTSDDSSILDGLPDAVVNNDPADAPPRGLTDSWNGHSEELHRQYFDDFVAVYYDNEVERPLEWPYQFLSNVWEYVVNNYGTFGDENRLYAIFHSETESTTPTYQTIFDELSSSRSIIDLPLNGLEMAGSNIDFPLEQISNIIAESSYGVQGSPVSEIWGSSSWAEIFKYDIYKSLEMEEEAQRIYDMYIESSVDSPSADTFWFRDWFLPIFDEYGAIAQNNFFELLSQNFPKESNTYTREMTLGEFVHFYSGATGEDLQPLAEEAFGWSDARETELLHARANFPTLDYPFEPIIKIVDLSLEGEITVNKENSDGASAKEGSLKLIDNDINTKFLFRDFDEFWMQQELPEAKVVNRYTLTSGNDAPERDPQDWVFLGSNDGSTWETLDTRTDETFSGRKETKEYIVSNEEAYKFYRLSITENAGASLFQLAEWRLLNWISLIEMPLEE